MVLHFDANGGGSFMTGDLTVKVSRETTSTLSALNLPWYFEREPDPHFYLAGSMDWSTTLSLNATLPTSAIFHVPISSTRSFHTCTHFSTFPFSQSCYAGHSISQHNNRARHDDHIAIYPRWVKLWFFSFVLLLQIHYYVFCTATFFWHAWTHSLAWYRQQCRT